MRYKTSPTEGTRAVSVLAAEKQSRKMKQISFLLLFALLACSSVWAGGRGFEQGYGGGGAGGPQGGQGSWGGEKDRGFGGSVGSYGRQNGRQDDSRKYRSNLYGDADVYGYDATYPNGEASYINYRSKDARARRGPEFARTSRAYSRQGGGGERGSNNFGQMNEYRGGGGGGGMW